MVPLNTVPSKAHTCFTCFTLFPSLPLSSPLFPSLPLSSPPPSFPPSNVAAVVVALREIIIVRYPTPTVHVYDVFEHGRHFRRSLVWTSDKHRTLSELIGQPTLTVRCVKFFDVL